MEQKESQTTQEKKVRYLSGPTSWYEYLFEDDNGNQKMIHLFGDAHEIKNLCDPSYRCMKSSKDKESDCYDLIYFLKELFDEVVDNQVYADMFLEIPYNIYKKDIYKLYQDTMIGKIFNQFNDCFKYHKKDCQYLPYVRMNYTDLRIAFHHDVTYDIPEKNISSFVDVIKNKYLDLETAFDRILRGEAKGLTSDQIVQIINYIDTLFDYVFNRYCDLYRVFLSDSYLVELNNFFEPMFQTFDKYSDEFSPSDIQLTKNVFELMKKLKHPKSNRSVIGYQIEELRKDNIKVNGKNIADLLEVFIQESCQKTFGDSLSGTSPEVGFASVAPDLKDSEKIYSNWMKISRAMLKVDRSNVVNVINSIRNFGSDLRYYTIILESYFLDVYILSRMFRTFSSSKREHLPSILTIVYAGDSHILTQSRFFEEVLKIRPIHKIPSVRIGKDSYKQCLQHNYFSDIFTQIEKKEKIPRGERKAALVPKDQHKWLEKNFNILYEGKDGMLLQPKEIGGFCEWIPNLDFCTGDQEVELETFICWLDPKGNKYCFDFINDEYKDEQNEKLDKDQIEMFRKKNPITSKLFKQHEDELLYPKGSKEIEYIKFPKRFYKNLYYYALDVIQGRWPEAEEMILSNPETAQDYRDNILGSD